ncbi:MAG: 3'-5' exonuclease [Myxococcota bacterium]|nr:3'-5' exonuclease [Myxococcota bacterium]
MSDDGARVTLRRFDGAFRLGRRPSDPSRLRTGVVVDVEATGLDTQADTVIEFAGRPFTFDRETGEVVAVGDPVSCLQDPGIPLSPEIVELTGLTDADLSGHALDVEAIRALLDSADVVIAHNARYDRPMVERAVGAMDKVWACSFAMVDWKSLGFPAAKLEILAIYHGYFYSGHRATADVDALLHLLTFGPPEAAGTYLQRLLAAARTRVAVVSAWGASFETKDDLKARGYRWNNAERVWWREVPMDAVEDEEKWLDASVYGGEGTPGVRPVNPFHRFRT